jgi:hypothetical protein
MIEFVLIWHISLALLNPRANSAGEPYLTLVAYAMGTTRHVPFVISLSGLAQLPFLFYSCFGKLLDVSGPGLLVLFSVFLFGFFVHVFLFFCFGKILEHSSLVLPVFFYFLLHVNISNSNIF